MLTQNPKIKFTRSQLQPLLQSGYHFQMGKRKCILRFSEEDEEIFNAYPHAKCFEFELSKPDKTSAVWRFFAADVEASDCDGNIIVDLITYRMTKDGYQQPG